jgi:flagellin
MLSINTNTSAYAALNALNATQTALTRMTTEVATGQKVSSAADNPAIYSISQAMDADIAGYAAVSDNLSFAAQVVGTASSSAASISSTLSSLANTVTQGQQQGLSAEQMNQSITAGLQQIDAFANSSTVNGVNLLAGATGNGVSSTQLNVLTDANGDQTPVGGVGPGAAINATSAGLGLDQLSVSTEGLTLDASNLTAGNIWDGGPTNTTVTMQNTMSGSASATAQNPGQKWTFEFVQTGVPPTTIPTPASTDSLGNVVQQDNVVAVPLPVGFTTEEAVTALQTAMQGAGFGVSVSNDNSMGIVGNNIDASGAGGPSGTVAVGNVDAGSTIALPTAAPAPTQQLTFPAGSTPVIGQTITGDNGIPAGTTIIGVSGTTVSLSQPTTSDIPAGASLRLTSAAPATTGPVSVDATSLMLSSVAGLAVGQVITSPIATTIQSIDASNNTITFSALAVGTTAAATDLVLDPAPLFTGQLVVRPGVGSYTLKMDSVDGLAVGQQAVDQTTYSAPPLSQTLVGMTFNAQITNVDALNNQVTLAVAATDPSQAGWTTGTTTFGAGSYPLPPAVPVSPWTGPQATIATIDNAVTQLGTAQATLGSASDLIGGTAKFTSALSSALTAGVGALIDADMATASARLTSLQTKEQLAMQSLTVANQQPQSLLSLFK